MGDRENGDCGWKTEDDPEAEADVLNDSTFLPFVALGGESSPCKRHVQ
jgi:hypothetical protein